MFRPQFPFPAPPPGFVYQPCIYQYSQSNVPGLASLALTSGEESGYIVLPTDKDAPFYLMGVKIQNAGIKLLLWDPKWNQLMDDFLLPSEYASELPPFTILEGGNGIRCEPGATFRVKFQGQ